MSFIKSLFLLLSCLFFFSNCSKKEPLKKGYISSIPNNAKVFINKKFVGKTPLFFNFKDNKEYLLSLKKENFYLYQSNLYFSENNQFKLVPKVKSIYVKVSPFPDLVFLNDSLVNIKEPIDLSYGKHDLFFFKNNLPMFSKKIEVNDYSKTSISVTFPKINNNNRLDIKSFPNNIDIFFANKKIGATPFTLRNIKNNLQLSFQKEGYFSTSIALKLKKSEKRTIIVRLKKKKATFNISFKGINNQSFIQLFNKNEFYQFKEKANVLQGQYKYIIKSPDKYLVKGTVMVSNDTFIKVNLTKKLKKKLSLVKKEKLPSFNLVTKQKEYLYFVDYLKKVVYGYKHKGFNFNKRYIKLNVLKKNVSLVSSFNEAYTLAFNGYLFNAKKTYNNDENGVKQIKFVNHLILTKDYIVVFDSLSYKISIFSHNFDLIREISNDDYLDIISMNSPLRFHQASFVKEKDMNIIYFSDISNNKVNFFNLKTYEKGTLFEKEDSNKPLLPYAITSYKGFILVSNFVNNKIYVYNRSKDFLEIKEVKEVKEKIEYLFFEEEYLYVITKEYLYIYET